MSDKCVKCGNELWEAEVATNKVDIALEQRRLRHWCSECGHEWDTLELAESEVVRLRGLAHRAVMGGV
jgi:DNA-directed RNA polymerase subunit RPC12/RpoP